MGRTADRIQAKIRHIDFLWREFARVEGRKQPTILKQIIQAKDELRELRKCKKKSKLGPKNQPTAQTSPEFEPETEQHLTAIKQDH